VGNWRGRSETEAADDKTHRKETDRNKTDRRGSWERQEKLERQWKLDRQVVDRDRYRR